MHRGDRWHAAILLTLCVCATLPGTGRAQVLRIGGFDFNAKARVQGVYATNVEQIKPSQTTEDLEDYYAVLGLDLTSVKQLGQDTSLDISTGIAEERHFMREDLDNTQNPFGNFSLKTKSRIGRIDLGGSAFYRRTAQAQYDSYSPKGMGRARDPRNEHGYGAVAAYEGNRWDTTVAYKHASEMHDKEQFSGLNRIQDAYYGETKLRVTDRFSPGYAYDWTNDDFTDNPEASRTQVNHRFILPFVVLKGDDDRSILRPALLYTFSWQQEDRGDDITPEWKPRHTVILSDSLMLLPTINASYFVAYDNYPQPAQDQIQFTYGANVGQQLGASARHSASVTRQPVATLGSTLQSDMTMYSYQFIKENLFIYDLDFILLYSFDHTIPEGSDTEPPRDTTRYDLALRYKRDLTRRLSRLIEYRYYHEKISTEPDAIDDHRFTIGYEYSF